MKWNSQDLLEKETFLEQRVEILPFIFAEIWAYLCSEKRTSKDGHIKNKAECDPWELKESDPENKFVVKNNYKPMRHPWYQNDS